MALDPDLTIDIPDFGVALAEARLPAPQDDWPPAAFQARNDFFDRMDRLWDGDLADIDVFGPTPVVGPNEFATYGRRLSALLCSSAPTAAGADLTQIAYELLTDMIRYGGGIVCVLDGGPGVPPPRLWFPAADGGHVVSWPWHSGVEKGVTTPDRLTISTGSEWATYEWDGTAVGDVVEAGGTGTVIAVAATPPLQSHWWGSTKFTEMFPLVVEIARRLSRNSQVLELYSGPIPVWTESTVDARSRFGVASDASAEEAAEDIIDGLGDLISQHRIHLDGPVTQMSLLQPHVQGVDYALRQVEVLREMVRDIAGVPDLSGRTLSGEALKRLFVHFYAESLILLDVARTALGEALGVEVEWEHPFDSGMFDPSTTGPQSMGDQQTEADGGMNGEQDGGE